MGVIRSANAPAKLAAFSLADIEREARAILLRAKQQADQLLAAAQAEGQTLKKLAYAQGLAEGRKEGLAKGREEGLKAGREQALSEYRGKLGAVVNSLTQAATQIEDSRRELFVAGGRDVIQLAIAIAQRVTKLQGAADPSVAMANVNEALKLVTHASDVRIAVHPSQKAAMDEAMPALKLKWPNLQHVAIIDEPQLSPGGCRVYTAQGLVDGDLDEQLSRVAADLLPGPGSAGPDANPRSPIANPKSEIRNPK